MEDITLLQFDVTILEVGSTSRAAKFWALATSLRPKSNLVHLWHNIMKPGKGHRHTC